jgi:hypothetical protein
MTRIFLPLTVFALFFLIDCKGNAIDEKTVKLPEGLEAGAVCYEEHVQPLLQSLCAPCHIEHSAGGVTLASLEGAKKNLDEVIEEVMEGEMPRGGKPKLTGAQAAVLKAWQGNGARTCAPAQEP